MKSKSFTYPSGVVLLWNFKSHQFVEDDCTDLWGVHTIRCLVELIDAVCSMI